MSDEPSPCSSLDIVRRAFVRYAVGPCPLIHLMPSAEGFIEAVCCWPDRNVYILLCASSGEVLRLTETPQPPLCSPQQHHLCEK